MKRIFCILVMLALLLCGCTEFEAVTVDHDVENYSERWDASAVDWYVFGDYSEQEADERLIMSNYAADELANYIFWEKIYLPVGEGYQILSEVKYEEKEDFKAELERISGLVYEKPVVYDEESFEYPAYVTILGYDASSEYVLVDEENYRLIYVFVEDVIEEDMVIDKEFLPKNYQSNGYVEDMVVNVYLKD